MIQWPVVKEFERERVLTTAADRLAEITGLLSYLPVGTTTASTTGMLDTTQKLSNLEDIKRSLDLLALLT